MEWANDYNLTHPVLSDPSFGYTTPFLYDSANFDGYFYLPNMQLLSQGRVVAVSNGWVSEGDIQNVLP